MVEYFGLCSSGYGREAFPASGPCRYAILDRDVKLGEAVTGRVKAGCVNPTRVSSQAFGRMGLRKGGSEVAEAALSCRIEEFACQSCEGDKPIVPPFP